MNIDPNTTTSLVSNEDNATNSIQQIMGKKYWKAKLTRTIQKTYYLWFGYFKMMHSAKNYFMIGLTKIWFMQRKLFKERDKGGDTQSM